MDNADKILMGERLRQYRENLGYEREQFAETLGISVGNYTRIESGRVKLTIDKVAILDRTYGCMDMSWLLFGKKSKLQMFGREYEDINQLWDDANDNEKMEIAIRFMGFETEVLKRKLEAKKRKEQRKAKDATA